VLRRDCATCQDARPNSEKYATNGGRPAGLAVAQSRVHQPANGEIARPRDARHKLLARADGCYLVGLFAGWRLGHNGRRALIVSSRWITPPSIITPRSANKLKKAKQLSGTASASNKRRFMANVSVSDFAAQSEF
jgi:hypothetical protein